MSCFSGMLASNAGFASLLRACEKNMLPAGVTGLSYLNKVHLKHPFRFGGYPPLSGKGFFPELNCRSVKGI